MDASEEVKAHISKVYKEKLESASCCGDGGGCGSTYPKSTEGMTMQQRNGR